MIHEAGMISVSLSFFLPKTVPEPQSWSLSLKFPFGSVEPCQTALQSMCFPLMTRIN